MRWPVSGSTHSRGEGAAFPAAGLGPAEKQEKTDAEKEQARAGGQKEGGIYS